MVHILGFDAVFLQIIGQILGHLDGQRCDQSALTALNACAYLAQQILDLTIDRAHHDDRVEQAGRTDDLLCHTAGMLALIFARRGGDKYLLMNLCLEFLKFQRTVVKGRRQTEAVFHQRFFAAVVTAEHAAHLRQHDMALIDHQEEIIREIIQQRCRGRARRPAGQHGRVVLDALAHAHLLQHLHVVVGALLDALGLQQLALLGEFLDLLLHLCADLFQSLLHLLRPDNVVAGREDGHMAHHIFMLARQGVKFNDAVDLVAKELYPDGVLVVVGQMNVHRIPFYAEFVPDEVHIIALILQLDQSAAKYITLHLHTGAQADDHAAVVNGVTQRVDAGYRCHNDDIAPLRQRGRS